jgi:uncharacterized protein YnzC (UPF0291/DUF896 family)
MAQTLNALIYPRTPDVISETRMIDVATIPEAKASWWRPVVDPGPPAHVAALEMVSKNAPVIEASRVVITYTKARRPLEQQKAAVKDEAQRRIIALTGRLSLMDCMIKQSNANMRANELNDKRVSGGTLTQEEETEATALRNLATAIKAIRAKSNAIELMDPIPLDYTTNSYWE